MIVEVCLAVGITVVLYRWLFPLFDSVPNVKGRTVFITGCDSGFGHELALKCLRHDMTVFAGCLTDQGCSSLVAKSRVIPIGSLHPIKLDVTDDVSVTNSVQQVENLLQGKGLDGVVNNAGVVNEGGPDDFLTVDSYKRTAEVNLFGVIRVTHAFKPLIKRNKGRIVNVASVCGRVSLPTLGPYTVSKYGVNAFTDTIRLELEPFGVKVSVLEPGFFRTNLAGEENAKHNWAKSWNAAPESVKDEYGQEFFETTMDNMVQFLRDVSSPNTHLVVNAYFHALTSKWPKRRYPVGNDFNYIFWPVSLLPSALQDFIVLGALKVRGSPLPASLRH